MIEQLKASLKNAQDNIDESSTHLENLNEEMQQLKNDYETVQEQNQLLINEKEKTTTILANLKEQIASNNEKVS